MANSARGQFAVLVRIHGPDPKGRKMRQQAFFHAEAGDTALSASGVLLLGHSSGPLVISSAAIVEPFLSPRQGHDQLQLVNGTKLEVLMQTSADLEAKPSWVSAELLSMVDVPLAAKDLKVLLDLQRGAGDSVWELGWMLNQVDGTPHLNALEGDNGRTMNGNVWGAGPVPNQGLLKTSLDLATSATRIAVLSLKIQLPAMQEKLVFSKACHVGDSILAMGSPFGALSPLHFFNSISVGIVSNCWPPSSQTNSLLMADIRCLPGMEGGPVFDNSYSLVGILLRPLRQRSSGAEVQLVLSATMVANALKEAGLSLPWSMKAETGGTMIANPCLNQYVSTAVDKAIESVVLITVAGSWGSGIILNRNGLILTNAHLVEPWRFVRKPGMRLDVSEMPKQDIRVRVDNDDDRSFHRARLVFVSRGPLDVALLQLDAAPAGLRPIVQEVRDPVPGSAAIVVGHGIFGPRSELRPSVTVGVVSKVLKAKQILDTDSERPLMLQTTAAVHPGGSGGVILDIAGRMIGLVTSNARLRSGTMIPRLNFSAPCARLQPVFTFASTDMKDLSFLQELNQEDDRISAVLAVEPPAPSKMVLDDQGKGSRFAKFISQQHKAGSKTGFSLRSSL